MFHPEKPYNDLPPLPPRGELESPAVLKLVIAASRALAEVKGAAGKIPNPHVLVSTIALQEARSSSEIEGIVTTQDNLFKAASDLETDPSTKEVLRYREALSRGVGWIQGGKPLCTRLYEDLVRTIKSSDSGVRKLPGTALRNSQTSAVVYTPPEGESLLRDKLQNLDDFVNDVLAPDLDPLIKMAIAHYQFEAIHPFHDGNGRVGRLLSILYLVRKGLLDQPVLYLSRYIIEHRSDYYQRLNEVTSLGAWEAWVSYMLLAVRDTSHKTLGQIEAIRACMAEFTAEAQAKCPDVSSKELTELLFEQPFCGIGQVITRLSVSRPTATKYLNSLRSANLLAKTKAGREYIYINHRFLSALHGH